jgi:hypothetical protein
MIIIDALHGHRQIENLLLHKLLNEKLATFIKKILIRGKKEEING